MACCCGGCDFCLPGNNFGNPFGCNPPPFGPICYSETTCAGDCVGDSGACDGTDYIVAIRDVETCCGPGFGEGDVCVTWFDLETCELRQTLNGVEMECGAFCEGDAEHSFEDHHYCPPTPIADFAQRIARAAGY